MRWRVFVNRRSGVAHCKRECRWLRDVPDEALRVVDVVDCRPRFRYCTSCSLKFVVQAARHRSAAPS
jgi:hypothetical protein